MTAVTDMRNPDYYARVGEKLLNEQPALNEHLGRFIASYAATAEEHAKMIETALFVYDALSRQTQADAMNQQL